MPLDAVDCRTGEAQPIEPMTIYSGEVEVRFIERIAGRTFTGLANAEGNADMSNEQGRSINGDDYAGYHTFNHDASIVVYGDMTVGPHYSNKIVTRDTRTGEQLWDAEFAAPFNRLHVVDRSVVIGFAADDTALLEGDSNVAGCWCSTPTPVSVVRRSRWGST